MPQYRIVVHPNSAEPVSYDGASQVARMGLPYLASYVDSLLSDAYRERLAD